MSDILEINSIDLNARGVSRYNNKVVFVDGALPGEKVVVDIVRKTKKYDLAVLKQIVTQSNFRKEPLCKHFGTCGGCIMQHIDPKSQVSMKQRILEDNLFHLGKINPDFILQAIYGLDWQYRCRAKFSVKLGSKKSFVSIGFLERRSLFVTDINYCPILHNDISKLISPLREVISQLSISRNIFNIEVSIGDNSVIHLSICTSNQLSYTDKSLLLKFEKEYNTKCWIQRGKNQELYQISNNDRELYYSLPEFGFLMHFNVNDFTQINHSVNRIMVSRVLSLLDIKPSDVILDLFCGLGNFTLPLATKARKVIGIDINNDLIVRASNIATFYKLDKIISFKVVNLFEIEMNWFSKLEIFDILLLDPPRDGAFSIVKSLSVCKKKFLPRRIVYVSCNPSTLSRDVNVLVYECGYTLKCAGVINMFTHTGHVESITVLEL
ncbi:23S rRNA (uracil(1939)-C(5))-methyltransferase RlmD [Candidatus Kinetoplastidibacterium crithidiae]|uniref:TrmA family RNA methyltransferase n=1 Tax=Candidatus Kinetoplastidibacterium crithidiae TCC036E TaxID=1208918 RepID=M1L4A5_9PROT|nr:23S rRNA (uracil(1939)-C(5))-methyltransferase RlmD [Candidatus Kinetoplastibacterium crithidii]AFZ82789.1 23S rRNA (uracil1939-C5)-methyltransferase [Candidatus Kinetoplastibacterium crithidii (ex Angomonas deanei ATCC 30255)]AGF47558.1 TrmA family RNA methyltransferase [Candidatus Kinetoplastibacterium crithidii TCC036E]